MFAIILSLFSSVGQGVPIKNSIRPFLLILGRAVLPKSDRRLSGLVGEKGRADDHG